MGMLVVASWLLLLMGWKVPDEALDETFDEGPGASQSKAV